MERIPKKLKIDPISEAILEIRFASSDVPEVIVGKLLAAGSIWKGGSTTRLPVADIPWSMRDCDPNLKVQPTLEIRPAIGGRLIKIGEHTLSYHALSPYPGWGEFSKELSETVAAIFLAGIIGIKIERIGFRYINSMDAKSHQVSGVEDLNLSVKIADKPVPPPLNLNYGRDHGAWHKSLVRLASREFILAASGDPPSVVVDIDIYTPDGIAPNSEAEITKWVELAHDLLKHEFFNLFTEIMFTNLVEQW